MARFEQADHLPNLRSGRDLDDPYQLPRQRAGKTPQMHGRYPDFNVVGQAHAWDEETRRLVLSRIGDVPPRRFFTKREWDTLVAFCDVELAQDSDPRIPVLAFVDQKLDSGRLDGFQYDDMPDDRDTWRLVAQGLDEAAQSHGASDYVAAGDAFRLAIADDFAKGHLGGGAWDQLNVGRAFKVVTRAMLSAFYSHPWAWNEIGFGGPAYPRGYARMGVGMSESWEGAEGLDIDPVKDVKERGLE